MSEEDMPASGELVPAEERELSSELSPEELAGHDGQALPEREAMSSLNLNISGVDNFAMPINEASALNYNSSYSVAAADADQTVILGQVAQGDSAPAEAQEAAPETQSGETTAEEADTTATATETTDAGSQATPTGDSSGE